MTYAYKCENPKCSLYDLNAFRDLPMSESAVPQHCKQCGKPLSRQYSAPTIKTGDGLK